MDITKFEIKNRITEYIGALFGDENRFKPLGMKIEEQRITKDFNLDIIDIYNLVLNLESYYHIVFNEKIFDNENITIKSLIDYIYDAKHDMLIAS